MIKSLSLRAKYNAHKRHYDIYWTDGGFLFAIKILWKKSGNSKWNDSNKRFYDKVSLAGWYTPPVNTVILQNVNGENEHNYALRVTGFLNIAVVKLKYF